VPLDAQAFVGSDFALDEKVRPDIGAASGSIFFSLEIGAHGFHPFRPRYLLARSVTVVGFTKHLPLSLATGRSAE
jgi:hypothetical protein